MRVLATGGAGYIGSQCVLELLDAGFEVVVYDNLSSGNRALLPPEARLVVGDVRDHALLHETLLAHDVEAVLHFAGLISVPESFSRPLDYYDVNVGGMIALLKAVAATRVRSLVFSSTAAVYAPQEAPIDEAGLVAPASPYGFSKSVAEQLLRDYGAVEDLTYTILRYFNVAGADPDRRTGPVNPGARHLFQAALSCAAGDATVLDVYGSDYATPDGTGVRDFIHVQDLATLHVSALRRLQAGGQSEVFNCGYGRGASVLDVARAVEQAVGAAVPLRLAPRRPGDLASVIADSRKVTSMLDWTPQWASVEEMAQHAWEWRRAWLERNASTESPDAP